jgi:glycine/D-amino acid oxidase-like deaminating enzyme/nitrite reductase/ring-hydroxylating ferredoxin subunit
MAIHPTNPSIWQITTRPTAFPALAERIEVDVAVVGGGITGVTTAMLLAAAGRSVAVVEAHAIGSGSTGGSTGNLYAVVGGGMASLVDKWGEDAAQAVVKSRASAVDLIESTVQKHGIDCAFRRVPWHLFTVPDAEDDEPRLVRELAACERAGLDAQLSVNTLLPFRTGPQLVVANQAQFHPLAYVADLARRIASERCFFFENSPVSHIDGAEGLVTTEHGSIEAEFIVMATHVPKGFDLVQTELGPYREYGVAAEIDTRDFPPGIFWSAGMNSRHSLRSLEFGGRRYVMAIGHKHKVGQEPDTRNCYDQLEAYLQRHTVPGDTVARWSAQGYFPADGLPYIGPSPGAERVFLATGFGVDGLVYGTLAAEMIVEAMHGRENPYAELYKATRVAPAKAAKNFVQENVNVVGEYVKDYATLLDAEDVDDLLPGEAKIVVMAGKRRAVHRTEAGELVAVSPFCTHLKCVVHWNEGERTWDCPCHGSRFAPDGTVIEGPAVGALERFEFGEPAAGDIAPQVAQSHTAGGRAPSAGPTSK